MLSEKEIPESADERIQEHRMGYVQDLYRLLFSHPSVEAITWWDFPDGRWQGAPAGLVRADLTPKPIYERLLEMVKGEWWTQNRGNTNGEGKYRFRGFRGEYDVNVRGLQSSFTLCQTGNQWTVEL